MQINSQSPIGYQTSVLVVPLNSIDSACSRFSTNDAKGLVFSNLSVEDSKDGDDIDEWEDIVIDDLSSDAEIVTEDSVKIFEGRENIKLNAAVVGKIDIETYSMLFRSNIRYANYKLGCCCSFIPIIGFLTFFLNKHTQYPNPRRTLALAACIISSFITIIAAVVIFSTYFVLV